MKMKTMRWWLGVTLTLVGMGGMAPAIGGPVRLGAQETDEAGGPRIGCFRGRPLPECKSFWITEMQGYTPLAQTSRLVSYGGGEPIPTRAFDSAVEWNVGHMVNLTPGFALGGTLSVGPHGGSGIFTGLKARARHWLSDDLSVEIAGGLLESGVRYPSARGATADVRINIRDQGSFFVRWDRVSVPGEQYSGMGYFDEGGAQQAISVGAGAGSVPGLVATGALGLGYLILLGVFLGNSS